VVRGTGAALKNLHHYRSVLMNWSDVYGEAVHLQALADRIK
jgi:hypothetical protein